MPSGSTIPRGNAAFNEILGITVTPPATITTAVVTNGNVTVKGLQPGDFIVWNQTSFASTLVTISNMCCTVADTLTISYTTEGATVSSAAAITFVIRVTRPENYVLTGFAGLPSSIS